MKNANYTFVRRWIGLLVKVLVAVAIVVGIVYWVRFQPVPVLDQEVTRGPIIAEVMGTGTLEARVKATISSKISGRIEDVLVDQGDRVTAGQLLVRLDDAELSQQVAIAEADVETKRAAVTRLNSDIARSAAILEQAKTNRDRMNSLIEKNAISRDELDKSLEALAIAEAGVSRSDAGLAEGRKALIVAERNLEFQQTKLDDAQIKAPFDGLLVRRHRDAGDVVVPGSAILTLISTDELWINAWVDETEMAALETGQTAKVIFRSDASAVLPGKLVRMGRETDRETREFIVDVEVLTLPENWAVGQRAEVYIETVKKSDVLQIPNEYVGQMDGQSGVYRDEKGFVVWQPVELGLRSREMVEVLSGLEEGQAVFVSAVSGKPLRPGQRIARQ